MNEYKSGVPNLGSADPFGSAAWLLWIRGRIPKKINILALIKKILIIFKLIFYNSFKKIKQSFARLSHDHAY